MIHRIFSILLLVSMLVSGVESDAQLNSFKYKNYMDEVIYLNEPLKGVNTVYNDYCTHVYFNVPDDQKLNNADQNPDLDANAYIFVASILADLGLNKVWDQKLPSIAFYEPGRKKAFHSPVHRKLKFYCQLKSIEGLTQYLFLVQDTYQGLAIVHLLMLNIVDSRLSSSVIVASFSQEGFGAYELSSFLLNNYLHVYLEYKSVDDFIEHIEAATIEQPISTNLVDSFIFHIDQKGYINSR